MTCVCVPFFVLLLLSSALLAASGAIPPSAEPSNSRPPSRTSDGIISLQQQNTTARSPLALTTPTNATVTVPTIVPISGTDVYLRITYIGPTLFAAGLVFSLFSSAHSAIEESVTWHPEAPVTPLPWYHSSYSKELRDTIAIRIRVNEGKVLTWLQLDWVLWGLLGFMEEGEPMHLHPVNFEVYVVAQGMLAAGLLWYSQLPPAEVLEES